MLNFDNAFIKKLKTGDHMTFNQFYLETVDMFFRYIKANYFIDDAECYDIISSYFVKQRENIHKIDVNKSFSAYTWTIFKNTIKDYFKKRSETPFSSLDNEDWEKFEDQLVSASDIKELMEKDFQLKNIQTALKKLDTNNREVIYFRFIEWKSNKEIADILQIAETNVRKKISRAIKSLKEILT